MRRLLLSFLLLAAVFVHRPVLAAADTSATLPAPPAKNSGWLVSIVLSAGALSGGIFLFGRYRKRR